MWSFRTGRSGPVGPTSPGGGGRLRPQWLLGGTSEDPGSWVWLDPSHPPGASSSGPPCCGLGTPRSRYHLGQYIGSEIVSWTFFIFSSININNSIVDPIPRPSLLIHHYTFHSFSYLWSTVVQKYWAGRKVIRIFP